MWQNILIICMWRMEIHNKSCWHLSTIYITSTRSVLRILFRIKRQLGVTYLLYANHHASWWHGAFGKQRNNGWIDLQWYRPLGSRLQIKIRHYQIYNQLNSMNHITKFRSPGVFFELHNNTELISYIYVCMW
jgi:hypothetical protein